MGRAALKSSTMLTTLIIAVTVSQFVTADEIEERGAFGNTNPPFKRIGCPAVENFQDEGAVKHDRYCFFQNTSCVPNKLDFPDVPKNNNVYRIIRARSWYFCGKNNTKNNSRHTLLVNTLID